MVTFFKTVIKRDGKEVGYNRDKIKKVISNCGVYGNTLNIVTSEVEKRLLEVVKDTTLDVEFIQNTIITILGELGLKDQQKEYIRYKKEREKIRLSKTDFMKVVEQLGVETDRDNANVGSNFSSKLLRIASETNKAYNLSKIPKELAKAHENGDYHIHDLDSYNLAPNCLHNPTGDILDSGFNTGYGTINKPTNIESASNLTCIILQSAQN